MIDFVQVVLVFGAAFFGSFLGAYLYDWVKRLDMRRG
jgi:hypothetical protein